MLLNRFPLVALAMPFLLSPVQAQDGATSDTITFDAQALLDSIGNSYVDSIEGSFTYQRGEIALSNGVATLNVPNGFKFLDEEQTSGDWWTSGATRALKAASA